MELIVTLIDNLASVSFLTANCRNGELAKWRVFLVIVWGAACCSADIYRRQSKNRTLNAVHCSHNYSQPHSQPYLEDTARTTGRQDDRTTGRQDVGWRCNCWPDLWHFFYYTWNFNFWPSEKFPIRGGSHWSGVGWGGLVGWESAQSSWSFVTELS